MSPIKSAVFRMYSLPRPAKKLYINSPMKDAFDAEVELTPPKKTADAFRALSIFREARSANDKYASYKANADAKRGQVDDKNRSAVSCLRKRSALDRMRAAASSVVVIQRMSILGRSERGGGNIGAVTDLRERLAKAKEESATKELARAKTS
jgi:hypothetical protein